jgi:hypothetical protein
MRMDTLSFTILHQRYDRFDALHWGTIDEALAQPTFAKLQRVKIMIAEDANVPPYDVVRINLIADRLPECNSRGILLVEGQLAHFVLN